jgi:uncharacterized membrane protein YjjB (DUF3815 family)
MKSPTKKSSESPASAAPARSSTAVRGKYYNRLQQGTNLIILDPALMPYFPDSASVNRALRAFLAIDHEVQEAGTPIRRRRPAASDTPDFHPRVGIQPRHASR